MNVIFEIIVFDGILFVMGTYRNPRRDDYVQQL